MSLMSVGAAIFLIFFISTPKVNGQDEPLLNTVNLSQEEQVLVDRNQEYSWVRSILFQVRQVFGVASATFRSVLHGSRSQLAVTGTLNPTAGSDAQFGFRTLQALHQARDPSFGVLQIHTPLRVDNSLTVSGEVVLSTSTISSLFATSAEFDSLTLQDLEVDGSLTAGNISSSIIQGGAIQASTLTAAGETSLNQLFVSGAAELTDLLVNNLFQTQSLQVLNDLQVSGPATLSGGAAVSGALTVDDTLTADGVAQLRGGVETFGADINLGEGRVFASNLVNEVLAGDNILIGGTPSAPIISVSLDDIDAVFSINNQTGDINLRGSGDVVVSGLTITSVATLASVRSRGGCSGCITDSDVAQNLTISGGQIDATPIGLATPAAGRFTELTVGTSTATTSLTVTGAVDVSGPFAVSGTATSTFGGSVNIEGGCFAVGGVCIAGATPTTYTSLLDTPASLENNAISFVNSAGSALTQSPTFVFDGTQLGVGTSTPTATLTVDGAALVTGALSVTSSATSTFSSGIDIESGCFAVNGTCLISGVDMLSALSDVSLSIPSDGDVLIYEAGDWVNRATSTLGFGDNTFLGLTDTESVFTAQAIPFVNSAGTLLQQSSNLRFDGSRLGVSASTLPTTLSIGGSISTLDGGAVRFYNSTSSNFVAFQAPGTLSSDVMFTLPSSDGSPNQLLVTDGSGNLRFDDVSSIGGGATTYLDLLDTPSLFVAGALQFANATSSELAQSNNLTFTDNRLRVDGDVRFLNAAGNVSFDYLRSGGRVGIGTEAGSNTLSVRGSIGQFGGTAGNPYIPVEVAGLTTGVQFNAIDIAGNFAFVTTEGSTNNFRVIDISNPLSPAEVSLRTVDGVARSIAVQGQYAYIGTSPTGNSFFVFDVSNPFNPVQASTLNFAGTVNDIEIRGRYAYIVTDSVIGNDEFFVVDISNPNELSIVDSVSLPDSARGLALSGNLVYAVSGVLGADLHVIDISNPLSPSLIGNGNLPTGGGNKVAVRGRYAYIAAGDDSTAFSVFDVSSSTNPTYVTSRSLPTSANNIAITGRYAYLVSAASGDDLHIYDIQDPTNPQLIGARDLSAGNANGIVVEGRYAFVTSQAPGRNFHVIDLTGAELQTAVAHSIRTGSMNVTDNVVVAGRLQAGLGLRAGIEGVQTDGVLAVQGLANSFVAGNFGVGTSSPFAKLTVEGEIAASTLAGPGMPNLVADAQGVIIRDPSDERLKQNISELEGSLETVLALRGVRYEWIDTERFGEGSTIGFLAQDVYELVPEAVQQHEDYWSLNPTRLLPHIVESIKELWQTVRGNREKIETLESRIDNLEQELRHYSSFNNNQDTYIPPPSSSNGGTASDVLDTEEEGDLLSTSTEPDQATSTQSESQFYENETVTSSSTEVYTDSLVEDEQSDVEQGDEVGGDTEEVSYSTPNQLTEESEDIVVEDI